MNKRNLFAVIATATLAIVPAAFGQNTSTLGVTVGPEATFASAFSATTLAKGDTSFLGFGGTTSFTYKIRTSQTSGVGAITVQVTAFSGIGPAVADLAYTCTAPSSGVPCSSSTPANTGTATSVIGFVADAHSADAGDAGSAIWTLVDRTGIKTGTYSSTATFTISAT
jgi:hypothetical protein